MEMLSSTFSNIHADRKELDEKEGHTKEVITIIMRKFPRLSKIRQNTDLGLK